MYIAENQAGRGFCLQGLTNYRINILNLSDMENLSKGISKVELPNETAILILGIVSIVSSFFLGIGGVICGIIGLKLSKSSIQIFDEDSNRYKSESIKIIRIGKICSIIGLSIGAVYLVYLILSFILFYFVTFTSSGS